MFCDCLYQSTVDQILILETESFAIFTSEKTPFSPNCLGIFLAGGTIMKQQEIDSPEMCSVRKGQSQSGKLSEMVTKAS